MSKFNDFNKQTLKEIKCWVWIAATLPTSSLVALVLIWLFGTERLIDIAVISIGSAMAVIAVIWWWWALHTIRVLVSHWDGTKEGVKSALDELKEIKLLIRDLFRK